MIDHLSKKLKYVLIGMLLGDANLQNFSVEKQTYRLRVLHSKKQIEYLEHKFFLFKNFTRANIGELKEYKNNKVYYKVYFNTVTDIKFKFFADMFYKDGKKKLPKLIHRYLNPISIAYWYMDDGSIKWKKKSKAVRICTDNFEKKEVERLVSILNLKFNLSARIFRNHSRFRIYIPNDEYKFSNLIIKHVHYSMKYKVPFYHL